MEIEQLSNLQLSSIKGGEWIYIAGEWYWIDIAGYDPEEDMEWTEEDEENEYDLDDVEKINKQVQRVMVKVLNRHRDEITIAMNAWMEKVVAEGTVPDELSEAIEYAIEFQLDNITEMPTDGVVR